MEADQSERLQKLVDNGTITSQQKTAIEVKLKEMKKEREAHKANFKEKTAAERKAEMQKHRSELEAWAKAQKLDLSKLKEVLGMRHGGPGVGEHAPTDS